MFEKSSIGDVGTGASEHSTLDFARMPEIGDSNATRYCKKYMNEGDLLENAINGPDGIYKFELQPAVTSAAFAFGHGFSAERWQNMGGALWPAAGVCVGDALINRVFFHDQARGTASTICDLGGAAIAFLPQSYAMRSIEMIGLHTVGKLIDKYEK